MLPFLLFACVLLLLFPVVSATDDLHALRQEIEESGPSKRLVKPVSGDRSPVLFSGAGAMAAPNSVGLFGPTYRADGRVWVSPTLIPKAATFHKHSSRAPPSFSPGKCFRFAA